MNEDPRCCGSGTCIIDTEDRCWCGQQWNGDKMCHAPPTLADGPDRSDVEEPQCPSCGSHSCTLTGLGQAVGWVRRWLACVAVLGLLAPLAAGAAILAEPDARAVRQVIEAQLDAFAADDAERAFSYASSSIRARFSDADNFMATVRDGYPMVMRPAAVSYFQAQTIGGAKGTVSQPVQLRDRAGCLWRATYLLERKAGAGRRINGCVVRTDSAKSWT
ncbi:MAG: DUF4864 domain-containing protein [Sulfuritalea sp.]|nr:DUF4864 domain-containing protein [Sulfuritalea sp.]